MPPKAFTSNSMSEKAIEAIVGLKKIAARTLRCFVFTGGMISDGDIRRKGSRQGSHGTPVSDAQRGCKKNPISNRPKSGLGISQIFHQEFLLNQRSVPHFLT